MEVGYIVVSCRGGTMRHARHAKWTCLSPFVVAAVWIDVRPARGQLPHEHGSAYKEVGKVHFPVSCTPAAQDEFDHGVALLHSFFWPETIKAFTAVAATDPNCTMAYWGIAISQRPNPLIGAPAATAQQLGWEAVEKAKTIPAKTQRESDYLGAMEVLYKGYGEVPYATRVTAYTGAMEQIY